MGVTLDRLLARQSWVDRIAKPVNHLLDGLLLPAEKAGTAPPRRHAKNVLNGVFMGHPVHPMLVALPQGAWSMTLLFDLASRRRPVEAHWAADLSVLVGLAGAGGSIATGLADWSDSDGVARTTGFLHGVAMSGSTTLFLASLLARRTGRQGRGQALSVLGYGLMMAGGYLGGHEVFKIGYAVDHSAFQVLPDAYVPVMPLDDLSQDVPTQSRAGDATIVLVRQGDNVHALSNLCTHMACPLSDGRLEGDTIICPCHGAQFALGDGAVVNGPATMPLPHLDVRVRNGYIEVKAPADLLRAPIGD